MPKAHVRLTVADHEKNGFVSLARWPETTEEAARQFVLTQDALVDDEAEPDSQSACFTFVLDIVDARNGDLIDTGKRMLPTQQAMSLAPDAVQRWLNERPEPDDVIDRAVPVVSAAA